MITIIQKQPAKYCACPGSRDIQQPAIIEVDGLTLQSDTPTSAMQALNINSEISRIAATLKEQS